jgi:GNAT superfamily N-acetyltransferase
MSGGPAGQSGAVIRRAGPSDAERLAALHVATWQQAYAGLLPETYLRSLRASQRLPMWQQLLASGARVAVLVAEVDGEPVGFASGGDATEGGTPGETGEMWTLYLLRRFWGQGLGRQLHDTLLEELERRRIVSMHLWVLASNERTRLWYERRGWQADGGERQADLWGLRVAEVRYSRRLGLET